MADPLFRPDPSVYAAVKSLRAVRRFRPDPIDDAHLVAVLEAARWTGSSKNRQAWAFVVVRDRTRLGLLAECGDFTGPIRHAPLVIAPVRSPDGYDWDLGRASQTIMLAAAALGIGSCPVTMHREDDGKRVLGIPADHGCRFVIALGYPDDEAERRSRAKIDLGGRHPLAELVHHETFLNGVTS